MEIEVEDGGSDQKIESLGVKSFVSSRVQEINSLSLQIAKTGGASSKGLAFQHVPKHMRRRAVSHNVKRVPKRLRTIHINQREKSSQSAGGPAKKPKRPSRKYRRRKSNLLEEYNRRQRTHKWLETHIWHAKRFHIENKWGYKLPISPTDKGYRALYRAASHHSAMRDISFCSCLQFEGPFEVISSKISKAFAPKECNPLSLSSEMYKTGQREGVMCFFKKDNYPFGYIGNVKFQWKRDQQALWMWVHPAQKEDIINELCNEFNLNEEITFKTKGVGVVEDEPMDVDGSETEKKLSIDEIKLKPKNLLERTTWKNEKAHLILTDLEGVFNRIRLYGPLSTQVLKETLQLLSRDKLDLSKSCDKSFWWTDYYSQNDGKFSKVLERQCELWKKLNNFSEVPYSSILPLTVRDPRVLIPQKRTKTTLDSVSKIKVLSKSSEEDVNMEEEDDEVQLDKVLDEFHECGEVCDSPLYSKDVRSRLVNEKMSDAEFSEHRSTLLIPGSRIDLGPEENQIPLILIHRPSRTTKGFQNGGWDLILPAGWAMQFWIAFSYRAVRACGLRDAIHFEFESGSTNVKNEDGFLLPPDSSPGIEEAQIMGKELRDNYFKQTPAKRENFIKLGCPFPFHIDWPILLKFNSSNVATDNFFILRDATKLHSLNYFATSKKVSLVDLDNLVESVPHKSNCLVGIRLVIIGKGVIEPGAVICIPSEEDFKFLNESSKSKSITNSEGLLEEPSQDDSSTHEERGKLREKHQKFMSFLRLKRRKLRKKSDTGVVNDKETNPYASAEISEFFNNKMESLWLPDSEKVLASMTKIPIGFVVFGHETYSMGKCTGLGYCSMSGLHRWISETKNSWNAKSLVLIRNCRDSLIYRLAKLEVCEIS